MGFLKDIAIAGAGYVIGSASNSNAVSEVMDRTFGTVKLEDYIDKFAKSHNIYVRDAAFARELRRIAEKYDDPFATENF